MKARKTIFGAILCVLAGLALSPRAQAVVPAPDGGYPGGNTAEGQNALLSLNVNTGINNTAVGWFSLKSNVEGQFNTALGAGTLVNNTGSGAGTGITTGSNIISIGAGVAGLSTTNGQVSDSCYIGNIHGAGVDAKTTLVVFVDQDGKLGTTALPGTGTLPNAHASSGTIQQLETTVAE